MGTSSPAAATAPMSTWAVTTAASPGAGSGSRQIDQPSPGTRTVSRSRRLKSRSSSTGRSLRRRLRSRAAARRCSSCSTWLSAAGGRWISRQSRIAPHSTSTTCGSTSEPLPLSPATPDREPARKSTPSAPHTTRNAAGYVALLAPSIDDDQRLPCSVRGVPRADEGDAGGSAALTAVHRQRGGPGIEERLAGDVRREVR